MFGGSDITIKNQLFFNNFSILQVVDYLGLVVELGDDCFNNSTNLTTVYFSDVLTGGNACFIYCYQLVTLTLPSIVSVGNDFCYECTNLTTCNMPILNSGGNYIFSYCTSLVYLNLPELVTIGSPITADCSLLATLDLPKLISCGDSAFAGCPSLVTINLSSCLNLGSTTEYNGVFSNTIGNTITLTIPAELMTCNSGNPDGDIQYLQANNTVTVIEVTPGPTPTPTPTPTSGTPTTPTPTPSSTSISLTPTPSPSFIPKEVFVNEFYQYTAEMFGSYSGGTIVAAPSGTTLPYPAILGDNGTIYYQLNAIQIGGFNGLNN